MTDKKESTVSFAEVFAAQLAEIAKNISEQSDNREESDDKGG